LQAGLVEKSLVYRCHELWI